MKKDPMIALLPALGCILACCGIGSLALLVITINSLVPTATIPFFYFEHLNLPILSVILPVLGMVVLAPVAIRMAFAKEAPAAEAAPVVETKPDAPAGHHLKAA